MIYYNYFKTENIINLPTLVKYFENGLKVTATGRMVLFAIHLERVSLLDRNFGVVLQEKKKARVQFGESYATIYQEDRRQTSFYQPFYYKPFSLDHGLGDGVVTYFTQARLIAW